MVTDAQVRKLMKEYITTNNLGQSALRAGMDRKTAGKYVKAGKLPSEMKSARSYRTRPNPFETDWSIIVDLLEMNPDLQSQTIFEHLCSRSPENYLPGQLRTLQRHIKRWRASSGPEKEIFFRQEHIPGEYFQCDFTNVDKVGITIAGEPFPHKFCHVVLPYSNWEWVTVCKSESLISLREGLQAAVRRLGHVPAMCQIDNSTAATHRLGPKHSKHPRAFNDEFLAVIEHLGFEGACTTGIGQKEQNGDVESANKHLKNRISQRLMIRGNCDFDDLGEYTQWLHDALIAFNRRRESKLKDELKHMSPAKFTNLPCYRETTCTVGTGSIISVSCNAYSVPSRLIGAKVTVKIFDSKIEVVHDGSSQLTTERLLGKKRHRINYRHVIWSLVRKPRAFARYRYREEMFPSVIFRRAYDALESHLGAKGADKEYLRILHLAASTCESEVALALELFACANEPPRFEAVLSAVKPKLVLPPAVQEIVVELESYDALILEAAQ